MFNNVNAGNQNSNFLNSMIKESNYSLTQNGGIAYNSSGSSCLDMFFYAGNLRNASEKEIENIVINAYTEDPDKAMKIIFFARDIRKGMGERRFFRTAVKTLISLAPLSVIRNVPLFAEYGRFDDLLILINTPLEMYAVKEIKSQLDADIASMKENKPVSLLAKWLPSVNASSAATRIKAKRIAFLCGMSERTYRKTLSALRKHIDILENYLRIREYTFNYERQPSCAMHKYRKAFIRNDEERFTTYINNVHNGTAKMNASCIYPYEIVRDSLNNNVSENERKALDATWKSLPDLNSAKKENAIAVVDGSGSMYSNYTPQNSNNIVPAHAAIALGLYFAEHSKGAFANHFITFSANPRVIEVKGRDIYEKVRNCAAYNECTNTNLEKVFKLILSTAISNKVPQSELPEKVYIISDMEFDRCISDSNNLPLFEAMKKLYRMYGYEIPQVVFWNVGYSRNVIPVRKTESGTAVVSGSSPNLFDMVMKGDISPEIVMNSIILSERYEPVKAARA